MQSVFKISTRHKRLLADTLTPVGIFQRLRGQYPHSVILESADYHAMHNSFSYIACDEVASFQLDNDIVTQKFPDGTVETFPLEKRKDGVKVLQEFASKFENPSSEFSFITNGLFGHITYDSVEYFEDIEIQDKSSETEIPQILYRVYRYVIAINHFRDELYIFEHTYTPDGQEPQISEDGLETLEFFVKNPKVSTSNFKAVGEESTNIDDDSMREIIHKCIGHCLRGDVFQIVPSRRFSRQFEGDDFNVYRALRSINPSPYLFYFDGGNYHIFGSSPEKQIFIKDGQAEIHPIAGTFRRTGDDEHDRELARQLHADPKESAEHVMLVDLARNDLSRSAENVKVETFKEVQFYSHVIHLVSKVTGKMHEGTNPLQLVADTFPAGTLSGAPKHNAMTIINRFEPTNRSIYGGAIGFMDFKGNFNHAIAIRTFLSKNNTLFYQAGMGVVAKSDVELEMKEIHLKLAALRKAIEMAGEI
ncbi:Chorismate binding domain-containing protein [Emticicia oligotrophica DSM 17448]|uniref:Anthranilate synthase component 1 n=1 Tax=Emticicia oligotrophica (strain DSM 17448 / CIP 109782 / MTCC 6937 / GPTSA100-15) TaxID=929562 RepID=A0ABN4APW9_EMTOG|nr:anthranilate synthase component I family protein [Emticicia oligotrophica]AFK03221.1 Chorismate binding domain-containing protein [Emticicia oligotrophica DSM 17448]